MVSRKCILALMLAVVFIFGCSAPSFAVNTQYATTHAFLDVLNDKDIRYSYVGIDNDDDENVTVSFKGDYKDTLKVNIYFNAEQDAVNMYIWNLIDFDESDYNSVLRTVNEVNSNYKYSTTCIDTHDWSVTVKFTMPIRSSSICGEMVEEELQLLVNVADEAYDMLRSYAK